MNIPNVPTDNLYKFMALSGLIVVIFSFFLPTVKIAEAEAQAILIEGESNLLNAEIDWLYEDTRSLTENIKQTDSKIDSLRDRLATMRTSKERQQQIPLVERLRDEIASANRAGDELRKNDREIQRKRISVRNRIAIQKNNLEEIRTYRWLMVAGALFGTGLSYLGFILWYRRVQKPIDIDLRQKIEKEIKKPRRLLKSIALVTRR